MNALNHFFYTEFHKSIFKAKSCWFPHSLKLWCFGTETRFLEQPIIPRTLPCNCKWRCLQFLIFDYQPAYVLYFERNFKILWNFPQSGEFYIYVVINVEILRAGYKRMNNLKIQVSGFETKIFVVLSIFCLSVQITGRRIIWKYNIEEVLQLLSTFIVDFEAILNTECNWHGQTYLTLLVWSFSL